MALSQFHPETIATTRAHRARQPGTCANDRNETPRLPCDCQPDPHDLEQVWAGRARMAKGREAAGVALDSIDREALAL